jgi:hypothetical protein
MEHSEFHTVLFYNSLNVLNGQNGEMSADSKSSGQILSPWMGEILDNPIPEAPAFIPQE